MDHVDPGHHLELLCGQMGGASNARRPKIDLARMGLGVSDELGNILGRKRWSDFQDHRLAGNARDWRHIADEIKIELFV
jgi:hypothetical protein